MSLDPRFQVFLDRLNEVDGGYLAADLAFVLAAAVEVATEAVVHGRCCWVKDYHDATCKAFTVLAMMDPGSEVTKRNMALVEWKARQIHHGFETAKKRKAKKR